MTRSPSFVVAHGAVGQPVTGEHMACRYCFWFLLLFLLLLPARRSQCAGISRRRVSLSLSLSVCVAQNAILLFLPVKYNLCRKRSATKFLCVKTSSGKFVAKSFSYRWIAGDVPIYLKFALIQSGPPLQKTPISTISLNSASAVRAIDKIQ